MKTVINNNNGVYLYCACTIITRAPSTLQWQQLMGAGVTKTSVHKSNGKRNTTYA